jgi:hypothetical protein
MTLSPEAVDVINYLKTFPGRYIAMMEISRQAGGRQRFKETPAWAKSLMNPLVEAGIIEMNERGHYRAKEAERPAATPTPSARAVKKPRGKIVGGDYFPTPQGSGVVGDNYFPPVD